jgi:exodeoxyribonuclease III
MTKTIISYNVNGIRASLKKGFAKWLKKQSPDIICLQEIKAGPTQIDMPSFEQLGYQCFIHSAEAGGYSGVMTLSKEIPLHSVAGMGIRRYDLEGRVLRTDYPELTILNVYIPSGTTGDVRQNFKMEFLAEFGSFVTKLLGKKRKILICGDYNICHKPIDINHPERHQKSSGFLPEERAWLDSLIRNGMIDTFRLFNKEPHQYSWWSYRSNSRAKNLGWRIDYHFVTEELKKQVIASTIISKVNHSDHCPIAITLDL